MNKKFKKLKTKIIKENPFVILTTSVIAIIIVYSLVLTPAIGKADNGDFGRMYNSFVYLI